MQTIYKDWGEVSDIYDEVLKYTNEKSLDVANEAQTRFDVIDRIIKEILQWKHGSIDVEEYDKGEKQGYVDYILKCANYKIIIEAKRYGASFVTPTKKNKIKINSALLSTGEINNAVIQAERYALSKNADIVCVTNGRCWCLYPYDQENDRNNIYATILFPLDSVKDCEELFNLLALPNVENDSLLHLSSEIIPVDKPNSLINASRDADARLGRNNVADLITPAIDSVLHGESIIGDQAKLRYCYVDTDTRTKYDNTLQVFLTDRKLNPNITSKRIGKDRREDELNLSIKNTKSNNNVPVTLLIGQVGAGKSTYLSYFELIHAQKLLHDKKCLWVNIDFEKMGKSGNPRLFIYKCLLEFISKEHPYIKTDYDGLIFPAYKDKIEGLQRGFFKLLKKDELDNQIFDLIKKDYDKVEPYVERLFAYIASKNLCVIVLDNIDLYEDTQLEINVFSEGVALSKNIKSNIIVSLRDTTYIKHRNESIFNAYELKKFWIDPPPFREVLSKRLKYGGLVLKNEKGQVKYNGMNLIIEDLGKFFDIVHATLLKDKNARFIENISDGNIRKGISLVNNFLTSAHIQADRAIYNYLAKDTVQYLPFHEVFKGCVLGTWKYYSEERAEIINLLNSGLNSSRLQLLRVYILKYLYIRAKDKNTLNTPIAKIVEVFSKFGATDNHILITLNFLYENRLVHNLEAKEIELNSVINITLCGSYYYKILLSDFNYLDAVLYDTHIFNDEIFDRLNYTNELVNNENDIVTKITYRMDRLKIFYEYLTFIEKESLADTGLDALGFLKEIRIPILRQVKKITQNASKYYGH